MDTPQYVPLGTQDRISNTSTSPIHKGILFLPLDGVAWGGGMMKNTRKQRDIGCTLPETNVEKLPENQWLEDEISF